MTVLALAVFVALHFVEAGYGYLFNRKFGPGIPNRIGWMAMESPVFIAMCILWLCSDRALEAGPLALFILFQSHYLQRAFVFPLLIRGRSQMPLGIVLMGMVFNTLNALMQGGWIFYVSPAGYYDGWFARPYIWVGGALFIAGMVINLRSDRIIRHLRRPGDTRHYIPYGGMFRYVSSANYFGELLGIRRLDVRQSGAAIGLALQTLRAGVRRGVHLAAPQTHPSFHLLIPWKKSRCCSHPTN